MGEDQSFELYQTNNNRVNGDQLKNGTVKSKPETGGSVNRKPALDCAKRKTFDPLRQRKLCMQHLPFRLQHHKVSSFRLNFHSFI